MVNEDKNHLTTLIYFEILSLHLVFFFVNLSMAKIEILMHFLTADERRLIVKREQSYLKRITKFFWEETC